MTTIHKQGKGWQTGILMAIFLVMTALLTKVIQMTAQLQTEYAQYWLFPLGMAAFLSGLSVLFLSRLVEEKTAPDTPHEVWHYPVIAAGLALTGMLLIYLFLGIWPTGTKTGMVVDMHHQYAPLLSYLRSRMLEGGSPLYSFEIGIGTSFLPLFAYYLASPFNLLLLLFPETLLAEGILVITLLKNALSAFFFALCLQYIYRRRELMVSIVSVMYALMMFLLAYSWNLMWLDGIMVLPLVLMSFERMLRTGKFLPYILSLAYALYANYYIGFMLCLFLVLYYLNYVLRRKRSGKQIGVSFGRFAVGSLLGGGLTMFLLIPTVLSLGDTSAAGGTLPELATEFDLLELLRQLMVGAEPTIRSGNLPNVYCGVLAVFLVPVYATTSAIPLRRRLTWLGLLAFLTVSLSLNQLNLVWHGLHAPNDLPHRFSFLLSLVLLFIAYEALLHLEKWNLRQLAIAGVGLGAWLILAERLDDKMPFEAVYLSLALVAVYALIFVLPVRRVMNRRVFSSLLLLVVATEMTVNGCYTIDRLNGNEYFTDHTNYVDNVTNDALRAMVKKTQEMGDRETDGSFYRMEFIPRRTCVDTALYGYRGITTFASSNAYETTRLMGSLGYAVNGVNSYLYESFVAPADSLLGIRYVALEVNIENHTQLKKRDSVTATRTYNDGTTGESTYYIYENAQALPLAYCVGSEIKDWSYSYYNPFRTQNSLYEAMTGDESEIYTYMPLQEGALSGGTELNGTTGFTFTPEKEGDTGSFVVALDQKGQYFAYVDCHAADSAQVEVEGGDTYSVTAHEPYIIDLGTLEEGDRVNVSVTAKDADGISGHIYICRLNTDVYDRAMQKLAAQGLQVTSFTDSTVNGTLTAPQDSVLMITLPYDPGWQVTVDGKAVKTFAAAEGFIGVEVTAGDHTVALRYVPRGLFLGLGISGVCLLLTVLIGWLQRERRRGGAPDGTMLLRPEPADGAPIVMHVDGNPLPAISLEELMREEPAVSDAQVESILAEQQAAKAAPSVSGDGTTDAIEAADAIDATGATDTPGAAAKPRSPSGDGWHRPET